MDHTIVPPAALVAAVELDRAALHTMLVALADVCDDAVQRDQHGFSKSDTRAGKSLARIAPDAWQPVHVAVACALVQMYQGQLRAMGFAVPVVSADRLARADRALIVRRVTTHDGGGWRVYFARTDTHAARVRALRCGMLTDADGLRAHLLSPIHAAAELVDVLIRAGFASELAVTTERDRVRALPPPPPPPPPLPRRRAQQDGDAVQLIFPYDALLIARVRAIPGRSYTGGGWRVPIVRNAAALTALLTGAGFAHDDTLAACLAQQAHVACFGGTSEHKAAGCRRAVVYDGAFKVLLTEFFREFLELFAPVLAAQLVDDDVTFLATESFADLIDTQRRNADMVVQTRLRTGNATILVHLEHQAQPDDVLARRMFRYFSRFHDRYDLPIYPIALCSYQRRHVEPTSYTVTVPPEEVLHFRYQVVQLKQLDWRAYLNTTNPVAVALMARMHIAQRDRWRVKAAAVRLAVGLPISADAERLVVRFVARYLVLRPVDDAAFRADVATYSQPEQERIMEIVTSWERQAHKAGRVKGRAEG